SFSRDAIEALYRGAFSTATAVELLWKGREAFRTLFDAVRSAEHCICLEFYIFRNDETGTELAELLKQKSREGVRVYLLFDHFGSFGTPRSFWNDMKAAGVSIRTSRPFTWTSPSRYLHRDHRKLIVIDGRKAFTGGVNIANEYSGFHLRTKGRGWRDTGILLEGPIAAELFALFKKSWYAWGGDSVRFLPESAAGQAAPEALGGIPVLPIFVNSARSRRKMRKILYYSITHARKSISLTTAYFTPSWHMVETLEKAVERGVRVRLLVPGISDVPAASHAGRAFFSRLLRAGVEIYTYNGEILHAKTSFFDECWSIIGSTNLDFQSLRYNDEGNVGILHKGFAVQMNEIYGEDLHHSTRIEYDAWKKRPFSDKLKEHFFSLFRRRL
ncbi:MAG: phospholipase D-like domain-containing protein, partial [Thermodesulfovibrionales bacterium]